MNGICTHMNGYLLMVNVEKYTIYIEHLGERNNSEAMVIIQ